MQACLFGKLLILYQQINFIFTENELYSVYPVISKSTKQLKIFVVRAVLASFALNESGTRMGTCIPKDKNANL
jgi:hypothetical protein